jgi:hypothetical protein
MDVVSIKGLPFQVTELYQLGDGRMEIRWTPTERAIDDEFQYLSEKLAMPVAKTARHAQMNNDQMHYLIDEGGKWYGIRCPKAAWELYLLAKGATDEEVKSFISTWTKSPTKELCPRELATKA